MNNEFIPGLVNAAVTIFVGLFAFVVYSMGKRSEKRNAAMIIVMDIRNAEQIIQTLLETSNFDISIKPILSENNWSKYKHLFASDFSYDDFALLNRFFDGCVEISDARRRMNEVFTASINAKAALLQEKIFAIESDKNEEFQSHRQALIDRFNNETYVFNLREPRDRIIKNLQLMGRLSGSVAFDKMRKIAEIKS
jgi:hypothetical protein